MRLDYAITIADPKSVNLLFTSASTKSELNKTDVMTALGLLQSRQPLGLSLIFAKYTKDKESNKRSSRELNRICQDMIPVQIHKKAHKKLKLMIYTLCEIAVNDYCRTPDSGMLVCRCKGRGITADHKLCARCRGTGLKRLSSVKIYSVINRISEVPRGEWSRHWMPFYDELVTFCEMNESEAEKEFKKIIV